MFSGFEDVKVPAHKEFLFYASRLHGCRAFPRRRLLCPRPTTTQRVPQVSLRLLGSQPHSRRFLPSEAGGAVSCVVADVTSSWMSCTERRPVIAPTRQQLPHGRRGGGGYLFVSYEETLSSMLIKCGNPSGVPRSLSHTHTHTHTHIRPLICVLML